MFDFMWSQENRIAKITMQEEQATQIVPTIWSEHCVECSAPDCYLSCEMYEARKDRQCVRISSGISPIIKNKKIVGEKLQFKKWAKIECIYNTHSISKEQCVKLYNCIHVMGTVANYIASHLPGRERKWIITKAVYSLRQKIIQSILRSHETEWSADLELLVRAKSRDTSKLIVEIKTKSRLLFRENVVLSNVISMSRLAIPRFDSSETIFLSLYPEDIMKPCNIEFETLELVEKVNMTVDEKPKVKLVIWDLDNTIWDGVLIESNVKCRESIIELIKTFDEKGIVNSICSKNDYSQAIAKIKELGLLDYFVFVKINWNPKSVNINETIKQMNISSDCVVFVDDSPFEREEVKARIPNIQVVDPTDIFELSATEKFDIAISRESNNRRKTYQMMEKQKNDMNKWMGEIDDFLRTCNMKLYIKTPEKLELARCYELLQRTNQLNASGRRLSMEEVEEYWLKSNYKTYSLFCEDKYGLYGQVGFAIVKEDDEIPVITDFVISCRVANKKIEHAFIQYLAKKYSKNKIRICYRKTTRNGPIFDVVIEMKMDKVNETENVEIYEYTYSKDTENQIVTVIEQK